MEILAMCKVLHQVLNSKTQIGKTTAVGGTTKTDVLGLDLSATMITEVKQEILMFENLDVELIKTPVDVDKFQELLEKSNYDHIETQFLIDGFREGFSIGYAGPENVKITAPNLKFREVGDPITL